MSEQWDGIVQATELLAQAESGELSTDDKVALWRDCKEAANLLYRTCKVLEPDLLREGDGGRGWHNGGRPVEVKRRFEIELLDPDAFAKWMQSLDDERSTAEPIEHTPKLTTVARGLVRDMVVKYGEKPDGVSAGHGNPFLSLGR